MAIGVRYDDGSGRIGTFSKGLHSPWGDVGRIGKMTKGLAGTRPIRQFGRTQKTPLQRIEEKKAEERVMFKRADLDREDPRMAGVAIGSAAQPHPLEADASSRTADGHNPWERSYLTGLHIEYEAPTRRYVIWAYLRSDKITGEGRTFETSGETRVPIFSFIVPEEPNPAPFDIVTGDDFVQTMTNCTFYYKGEQKTVPDFDLTVATDDGEHTVYLVVTDDGSAAPTFSISNTEIEDDGVTCYKLYDFKDGEVTCDYRTTFLTIGSEDEVEVDDTSIESSREIPSEIEGEEPTVVEELAIKGWHDKDNSSSKLGDLLTGSAEDTSRQVLVRNGKGGATEYLPIGQVESAKDGKLTLKDGDGNTLGDFTANQEADKTITIPSGAKNGKLTIKYGNVEKGSFTANQSTDTEIVIPEPTIPQPIQPNDGKLKVQFGTDAAVQKFSANQSTDSTIQFAKVASTGSYNDLLDKPQIPTIPDVTVEGTIGTNQAVGSIAVDTTDKHKLKITGVNLPTIPDIEIDTSAVTSGKAIGGLTVDATNKHKIIASAVDIPAAQIQSDWNQTNSTAKDFIKNKPTIPAEQVNSDWNATSGKAQILNKPTIPTALQGSDYIDIPTTGTDAGKVKAKVSPTTTDPHALVTTDTSQTIKGSKIFGSAVRIRYDSNGEGTYFPNAIYFKPKEGSTSWISFYDSVTGNNVIAQLYCTSAGRLRLISYENGVNVEAPNTPHIYLHDKEHTLFLADIFARYEAADGVVHPLILKGDMYGSGTVAQIVIGHDATSGQPVFRISRKPDDSTDVASRDLMTLGNANDKFLRIANLVAGQNITITPDTTNPKKLTIAANIPQPVTGTVNFVGDMRYDVSTHQLQKRVDTLNLATGAVTEGAWTMITGGQAVPHGESEG